MAVPISTLDHFKVETTFGDGYVEHTTYEWEFSTKVREQVSKWEEVRCIGSGAFGSVWLEKEQKGGQLRAVKRLPRTALPGTGFSQELLALITLRGHKHLFVEFLGWYDNRSEIFLAMEYVPNGDLSDYMKDQQTARAEAGEVTRQILQGLKILHGEAICHRDLKPQNVLVASLDPLWVKIADFGTSKRTNNTVLVTFCGTPKYMAPELLGLIPRKFRAREEFSYALDMWALGCIIHELLTSEIPFLDTFEDDEISGMESCATVDRGVDMQLLYEYCHGGGEFHSDSLHTSLATAEAIMLVQSLLVPNPRDRPSAASALQNSWVGNTGYKGAWYRDLEREFLSLGVVLDLEHGGAVIRQLRMSDIATVLPPMADITDLLESALLQQCNTAAVALFSSLSRQSTGHSQVQYIVNRLVAGDKLHALQLLLLMMNNTDGISSGILAAVVEGGLIDIVQLLLDNKGDVNAQFSDGRTAWQAALGGGNVELVKLCLAKGADVNDKFNSGWTPLQVAAGGGHIEVIILLLDNKAEINAQPVYSAGRTALQAAAGGGHIEIVKLLLDNEADINAKPGRRNGRTALQAAAGGGHIQIVWMLMKKTDINAQPAYWNGLTALQAAAGGGHIEIVKLLLDNEADINAEPGQWSGLTALQAAAGGGHIEVVKLLLARKADINAKPGPWTGLTALQAAAAGKHTKVVELLVANGARGP